MIRFPNIQCLIIEDFEKQHLYNSIYDIFIAYKNEAVQNIFRNQEQSTLAVSPSQPIDVSDILKYKDIERSKEQKEADIIQQFKYVSIYEYAGFELTSSKNPIFVNQFLQKQNTKENIVRMIKHAKFIDDKQAYIDAVMNIPDTNEDLINKFKSNLLEKINKENFDAMVENILSVLGSFLQKNFDGKKTFPGSGAKLPPLYGIEEDLLDLYKHPQFQKDLIESLPGQKIQKYANDPFVICVAKMAFRVYNNYTETRLDEQRRLYMEQQKRKTLKRQ